MNKYEFERKVQNGEDLMEDRDFEGAVAIFDELNLNLIEQPRRLQNIADAYEKCRRYEDAEDILLMALEMTPKSRGLLVRLCNVALKNGGLDAAKEYYEDFCHIAKDDPERMILAYKIAVAENQPDAKLIRILEQYKREEPDDRWLYELAQLYARNDRYEEAAQVCDDIDLWFNSGKYLERAHALRDQLIGLPNVPEDAAPSDPYKEEENQEVFDSEEAIADFSEEEQPPETDETVEEEPAEGDLNVTSETPHFETENLTFPYQFGEELEEDEPEQDDAGMAVEPDLPDIPLKAPEFIDLSFSLEAGEMRTEVERFFSEDRGISTRPVNSTVDEVETEGVFAADDLYSFEGFTAPGEKSELLKEAEAAVFPEMEFEEEDETINAPDEHVIFSVTKTPDNVAKGSAKEEDEDATADEEDTESEKTDEKEETLDSDFLDDEDDEDEEEVVEDSPETIAMKEEEARIAEDEELFGMPLDRGVTNSTWHFLVFGKNNGLTLQCAREKMKEISERNADCPSKLLKITSEKIGSASIQSALEHFVGNMVIVEQAASLSPKQLQEFAAVLNKDDRSLLVAFTDTRTNVLNMLKKVPELKNSFTAVFEGKQYVEKDLFDYARLTLFRNKARLTENGEDFMLDFCDDLLEEKQGYYEIEIESLIKKAIARAEKGGFLGIGRGKKNKEGYLLISEKYLRKAEAE